MLKAVSGSSVSLLGAISTRVSELDQWVRLLSGLIGLLVGLLTLIFVIGPQAWKQWKKWRVRVNLKRNLSIAAAGLILGATMTGCSAKANVRREATSVLTESSKQLTTATVDALNLQPTERRDGYTETAKRMAEQNQKIQGIPVERIDVGPLVASNKLAWELVGQKFAEQNATLAKLRESEAQLLAMGEKYEEERNRSVVRRIWTWLIGSLGIGGLVALAIFCPALIPIFGRILGWIVAKLPSLAGWIGVVSTKAFDNVVLGVEKARQKIGVADDTLKTELSKAMDDADKTLVRTRKVSITP